MIQEHYVVVVVFLLFVFVFLTVHVHFLAIDQEKENMRWSVSELWTQEEVVIGVLQNIFKVTWRFNVT